MSGDLGSPGETGVSRSTSPARAIWHRWVDLALAHPRRTLVLTFVVLVIAAAGLPRLELRTDGRALVPPADPAVLHDDAVRREFGLRDPIVVALGTEHVDGIYNRETFARVIALTEALTGLDGVEAEQVVSLATEKGDRVRPGTLEFRAFLDRMPESEEDLARVRADIEAVDVLVGTLISLPDEDGRTAWTAILVGVPLATDGEGAEGSPDRAALYHRVEEVVRPLAGADTVVVVGAPVAEALLGDHIVEDLLLLLPLAVTLMSLVLWLGCRRFWGVMLGLGEVGAVLIFVFGVMGWLGVPVYLTTAVLPVVLVTIGLADEIHIFWRHQRVLDRDGVTATDAPRITLREMAPPVILTSITTSVGFLSFLASPLVAVRGFGAFAALGILFCLVFSLTAVPAALELLGAERLRRPKSARGAGGQDRGGASIAWAHAALDRPRAVIALLVVLTALGGLGISKVRVQDSWIDGFAEGSEFRQATGAVNNAFHGTHLLLLDIELDPPEAEIRGVRHGQPGPLLLSDRLWKIGQLEQFVREHPGVGGVLGPYSQLLTASYLKQGRQEVYRTVPYEPGEVAKLLHWFGKARGVHRVREIYHDDRDRAIVTVFLEEANYLDTETLMVSIREWENEHLRPFGLSITFAGDVTVSQAMIPVIVRSQVSSLLLALGGALLVVSLLRRSLIEGLLIVAPASFAVAWVFGAMGWLGIPLGVATSMFCAITLGIGVDYGIHFFHAWKTASETGERNPVRQALRRTGPAILFDTLAIAFGFGLLVLSQVPANARLGFLVAMALVSGCVATLVGLGAVLERRDAGGESGTERPEPLPIAEQP